MKPHITKVGGYWWCACGLELPVFGLTPVAAYVSWKSLNDTKVRVTAFYRD